MMQAWLGLGANLQKPLVQLEEAVRRIAQTDGVDVIAVSTFYQTPPWGEEDQPDFINAVARIETRLDPLDLLHHMQDIENEMGRVRKGSQWGPRLIDIDVLLYADLCILSEELTLPHPRMHERAFVLLPLCELEPEIEIPGRGRADSFLAGLDSEKITPYVGVCD